MYPGNPHLVLNLQWEMVHLPFSTLSGKLPLLSRLLPIRHLEDSRQECGVPTIADGKYTSLLRFPSNADKCFCILKDTVLFYRSSLLQALVLQDLPFSGTIAWIILVQLAHPYVPKSQLYLCIVQFFQVIGQFQDLSQFFRGLQSDPCRRMRHHFR